MPKMLTLAKPNRLLPFMLFHGAPVAQEILKLTQEQFHTPTPPTLFILQVGNDAASTAYINSKAAVCKRNNAVVTTQQLPEDSSESQVISCIEQANSHDHIHGIIVQLPLPKKLNTTTLLNHIAPHKDVDCLSALNLGTFFSNPSTTSLSPPTTQAVIALLNAMNIKLSGARALMLGYGNLVGKPTACALAHLGATVSVGHSHSRPEDLEQLCKNSDIVISGTGVAEVIPHTWLPSHCVVIDAGITRLPDGVLVGDINSRKAVHSVRAITPVPGGVGPVTVACLVRNLFLLAHRQMTLS